ncbi:MAG: WecB/TagA/CpsF family glycosyltransferase [Kiritimatiellae bacterium]|nr:WecB/TagA/CpsF family glycosyltransferase [Kiritimatiellia bacterium]
MKTVEILGVPVAQVDYSAVLGLLETWVREPLGRTHCVVAANTHVLTEAALNPEYRQAIVGADLIVPDGMPLVWAARLLGGTIRTRCYGPTLMRKAFECFQGYDVSHYLYGTTRENLERLLQVVKTTWPDTFVAGCHAPSFGSLDDEIEQHSIESINASGAHILWLGMGCPKQELWMHRFRHKLRVPVALGVGAAFDFLSGAKPQAPAWLGNSGLEWAYRLCTEPRRLWRRYLFRNPLFLWLFIRQLASRSGRVRIRRQKGGTLTPSDATP